MDRWKKVVNKVRIRSRFAKGRMIETEYIQCDGKHGVKGGGVGGGGNLYTVV